MKTLEIGGFGPLPQDSGGDIFGVFVLLVENKGLFGVTTHFSTHHSHKSLFFRHSPTWGLDMGTRMWYTGSMSEQKRDRKAEWAAKNKAKRAEKAREARKLARITKMVSVEEGPGSLAEVFKAEEGRKALAARAQQVGDDMQAQRWADRVAEDAAKQAADLALRQTDPQAWAVEQLRVMLAAPYEQERVRRLQETAFNMGVPLDQLDTTDSFRIEQMIRAMAYCPDSDEQPFEAGVRWAAGQLLQLTERGYMPNANTADDLIIQLRSEKGLL